MLQQIADFVNHNLAASAGMVGLALELILRAVPTEKPKSILLAVSAAVDKLAEIISGVAKFLHNILPQNLK